jgi:hypothetical protein
LVNIISPVGVSVRHSTTAQVGKHLGADLAQELAAAEMDRLRAESALSNQVRPRFLLILFIRAVALPLPFRCCPDSTFESVLCARCPATSSRDVRFDAFPGLFCCPVTPTRRSAGPDA